MTETTANYDQTWKEAIGEYFELFFLFTAKLTRFRSQTPLRSRRYENITTDKITTLFTYLGRIYYAQV